MFARTKEILKGVRAAWAAKFSQQKATKIEATKTHACRPTLTRRHHRIAACAKQAIAAKARLILKGKGANGRSMSPALLEHHMNLR